jgi:hypothetical protein
LLDLLCTIFTTRSRARISWMKLACGTQKCLRESEDTSVQFNHQRLHQHAPARFASERVLFHSGGRFRPLMVCTRNLLSHPNNLPARPPANFVSRGCAPKCKERNPFSFATYDADVKIVIERPNRKSVAHEQSINRDSSSKLVLASHARQTIFTRQCLLALDKHRQP